MRLSPVSFEEVMDIYLKACMSLQRRMLTKDEIYNTEVFEDEGLGLKFPDVSIRAMVHKTKGVIVVYYEKSYDKIQPMKLGKIGDMLVLVMDDIKVHGLDYEKVAPKLPLLMRVTSIVDYPGFELTAGELAGKLAVKLNDK